MTLEEKVEYPEELLPDEGEALKCTAIREIGRAARSGAEMWARRPSPVEPGPEELTPKGAAIGSTLAV